MKNQVAALFTKGTGLVLTLAMMVAASCTPQEDLTPTQVAPELLVPTNILTFADGEALQNAISEVKAGTFEASNYTEGNFVSLRDEWNSLESLVDIYLAPMVGLDSATEDALAYYEEEINAIKTRIAALESSYGDIAQFEEGFPVRMRFDDGLMAHLVNRQGMLIIGTRLFRYTNEGFMHTPLSTEYNAVAEILATKPGERVQSVILEQPKAQIMSRDQIVAQNGMNTGGTTLQWESYAKVTNTYTPITRTYQKWVPRTCTPVDPCFAGICEICTGGYYETVTEVIGESLTNTRIYADSHTFKRNCFILCFGTREVTAMHNLTVTGAIYANRYLSTSRAVVEQDLYYPAYSGSLSVNASINLLGGVLIYNLNW